MNKAIFPLFYFGPIDYYASIIKANDITFELHEHYVKQSYRTRCSILAANGRLNLVVPTLKSKTKTRDTIGSVRISNNENWKMLHWKSIQSAYHSSPYFEYYKDELAPIFDTELELLNLCELNLLSFKKVIELLNLNLAYDFSSNYIDSTVKLDFRTVFNSKSDFTVNNFNDKSYIQVFSDKHQFIKNLSILDLLFNEGPNSVNYLKTLTK